MKICVALLALVAVGCSKNNLQTPSCGSGTHPTSSGGCAVDVICGPSTMQVGDVCLATTPNGVTCGPGTRADGSQCVPDGGSDGGTTSSTSDGGVGLTCGAGTHESGGVCVSDGTTSCGSGTHDVGGVCYPDDTCGPGTHAGSDGSCVPNGTSGGPQYQVRIAVDSIGADGFSKIPLFVIGTHADGSPATDDVVLTTSIPGEATIAPQSLSVSSVGSAAYLTPCNSAQTPACLGTFVVNLALASAPTAVIATSPPIMLVAPTGVGSDAACLGGGNVVFFDGDAGDYIHPGTDTITQGSWSIQSDGATPDNITVNLTPMDSSQGLWWTLNFTSTQLNEPLDEQVYQNAMRAAFTTAGHPGLEVTGDGRGCNTISGQFQIEDLTMSGTTVKSFAATFEQHCEGGSPALHGCVHFAQ
jgi:hypothetical protein